VLFVPDARHTNGNSRPTQLGCRRPRLSPGGPGSCRACARRRSSLSSPSLIVLSTLLAAVVVTYWEVGGALVGQWVADENYSHGFLIPPVAAYFAWKRRARLQELSCAPSAWGVTIVALSLIMLAAGVAAAELFVARASFVGVLAGSVLFLCGWQHLRVLAFPIAFLFLMIPPPEILFNQVALPLQLFASQAGELTLRTFGVPVLRDGNVLELASMRLEVAEACSGIRSIVSLLAFSLMLGQFGGCSTRRLWMLALSTIPIAVAANATRVAATGLAAHSYGRAAAEGFLHTTSGLLVFGVAVFTLLLFDRAMSRVTPRLPRTT
jgi:exosortase